MIDHKQLLDEVFVISRIIKLDVRTLIILDITKKPNLTIVLLYIEQKKVWKSCSCFFTDGNQHIASEFDMITLDLECP